jgi:hypothetical protein
MWVKDQFQAVERGETGGRVATRGSRFDTSVWGFVDPPEVDRPVHGDQRLHRIGGFLPHGDL